MHFMFEISSLMTSRNPGFYHISRSSAAVDIEQRANGKSPSRIDVRAPKAEKTNKKSEGFNFTKITLKFEI